MPAGIPVGTLAIGAAGATNAGLLATSILSTQYPSFASALESYRSKQTDDVAEAPVDPSSSSHSAPSSSSSSHSAPSSSSHSAPSSHPVTSILSAATHAASTAATAHPTPQGAPASAPKQSGTKVLPPGSTIGILGGGQLGRMTAIAAAQLGYRVHVFCPDKDPPCEQVANKTFTAKYSDKSALDAFAASVDVVTYEFENINAEAVDHLAEKVPVFPDSKVLRTCQDRITEKTFLNSIGVATTAWTPVASAAQLRDAARQIGLPAILKSNTLGYDGKGQAKIEEGTDLDAAWAVAMGTGSSGAILEKFVPFQCEVSVIVARGTDGSVATYPVVENVHRNHILHKTYVPPRAVSADTQREAIAVARRVAEGVGLVGVLAVEMFVAPGGVLVNELAPRPHNSGHWTIEGVATSQFEQVVRAVCGLPLGHIGKAAKCEMTNLIGKEVDQWAEFVGQDGVHLHIYGKAEAREGRKMGHVTKVFDE